jgi:hypothetical protein
MLQDGGQRHGQRLRELADRRRTLAEPLEHPPSAGIGERVENPVQVQFRVQHIVKHMLEYGVPYGNSQAIT